MESLEAITRLLACEEPVTMKTDWFEMREGRLHHHAHNASCRVLRAA